MSIAKDLLRVSPKVAQALANRQPVVALESTIISHGMPYPRNVECALEVEHEVATHGATPATIALIKGQICVGLEKDDIQLLAQDNQVRKVSRRDIPFTLARRELGSTTVAATMICSAMAGIDVFVTGGMGGVHRDVNETMDVSADLREIGRTPVTVVSAGVKSILDIPRTLQYLETEGVPVITYGSEQFPAFYSPNSGIKSPLSLHSVQDIAQVLLTHKRLQLKNGILVGVPPADSGHGQVIEQSIERALKQAQQQGIKGAATTPFVLKKVQEYSGGVSLDANVALIKCNAQIGSKLAVHYNRLLHEPSSQHTNTVHSNQSYAGQGKLIAIGAAAVDYQIRPDNELKLYQSCPGTWTSTFGGVARNIAEAACRLGVETHLVTAVGGDSVSREIKQGIKDIGIHGHFITNPALKGASFLEIFDDKNEGIVAISDMKVNPMLTVDNIHSTFFKKEEEKGCNPKDIVLIDVNYQGQPGDLLRQLKYFHEKGYFVVMECKASKSLRIFEDNAYEYISLLRMNETECKIITDQLVKRGVKAEDNLKWFASNIGSKSKGHPYTEARAVITKGTENITIVAPESVKSVTPVKSDKLVKTTGAGDTLTGTIIALLLRGKPIEEAVRWGSVASKMTVESTSSYSVISDQLNYERLEEEVGSLRAKQLI